MTKELTITLDEFKDEFSLQLNKLKTEGKKSRFKIEDVSEEFMHKHMAWFNKIGKFYYTTWKVIHNYIETDSTLYAGINRGMTLALVTLDEFKEEFNKHKHTDFITHDIMDACLVFIWNVHLKWYNARYEDWKESLASCIKDDRIDIYSEPKSVICLDKNSEYFLKECKVLAKLKNYEHYIWDCNAGYDGYILKFENEPFFINTTKKFCNIECYATESFGFKSADTVYLLKEDAIYDATVVSIVLDKFGKDDDIKENDVLLKLKPYYVDDLYKNYMDNTTGNIKKIENNFVFSKKHSTQEKIFLNKVEAEQYKFNRDEKEKEFSKPIKFTVKNKNGIYEFSDSLNIGRTTSFIRVQSEEPNQIRDILKSVFIKDKEIKIKEVFSEYYSPTCIDLYSEHFINSTNDLKFDLNEGSKIEVLLAFKKYENIEL